MDTGTSASAIEHPHTSSERVGIVGLGIIGGGIARALVRNGVRPVVFDVRTEAMESLDGTLAARSCADVARQADVVLVAVVDAEQAHAVLAGDDGLLAGAHPDLVVVVLSTVAVAAVRSLRALAEEAGVALVDAGVTGRPETIATGELVCLVGGDDAAVSRAGRALDRFSRKWLHVGPSGAGMAAKLARNVLTYGSWAVAYEAGLLAESAGVDVGRLVEAVDAADPNGEMMLQLLRRRGTVAPVTADEVAAGSARRTLAYLDKDLAAARELAAEIGVDMPIADLAARRGAAVVGLDGVDDAQG